MTIDIDIPNIDTSYSGIKFAYEQEGKYNTRYVADCIEYGERFYTEFFAPKNYSKETIRQLGIDLAAGWGGECIEVYKAVMNEKTNRIDLVELN